jgi:hypothetical protein
MEQNLTHTNPSMILITEVEFPLININGIWLARRPVAPSYGKLTPDQMYSSNTPVSEVTRKGDD